MAERQGGRDRYIDRERERKREREGAQEISAGGASAPLLPEAIRFQVMSLLIARLFAIRPLSSATGNTSPFFKTLTLQLRPEYGLGLFSCAEFARERLQA